MTDSTQWLFLFALAIFATVLIIAGTQPNI
jgi:hypothetical protein